MSRNGLQLPGSTPSAGLSSPYISFMLPPHSCLFPFPQRGLFSFSNCGLWGRKLWIILLSFRESNSTTSVTRTTSDFFLAHERFVEPRPLFSSHSCPHPPVSFSSPGPSPLFSFFSRICAYRVGLLASSPAITCIVSLPQLSFDVVRLLEFSSSFFSSAKLPLSLRPRSWVSSCNLASSRYNPLFLYPFMEEDPLRRDVLELVFLLFAGLPCTAPPEK